VRRMQTSSELPVTSVSQGSRALIRETDAKNCDPSPAQGVRDWMARRREDQIRCANQQRIEVQKLCLCCPCSVDVRIRESVIGSDGGLEESLGEEPDRRSALRDRKVGRGEEQIRPAGSMIMTHSDGSEGAERRLRGLGLKYMSSAVMMWTCAV